MRGLRRARTLVPVLVCVVAIGALLVGGLSRNVVYFRTVSEAVSSRPSDGSGRLRVAGAVVPGSVVSSGGETSFELTDGAATVRVHHHGDPPELFEDGAPVVSEGHWLGSEFDSDRLMIKHGSEYEPPAVTQGAAK
ncbi:MAG TPA: cytochrome c maturation protein CcmE [Acidimicrobiales bacterium]|jgi:cytochrome c-type biogenesis protein CcmE|nr:cytochrome c maturation protein CcmE [Acidimicrobiales bacterium]